MQLGWRYPDAHPARDTRYQDIRLYARPLTAEEAKRLPYEDYVAEITSKPTANGTRMNGISVSQFYFNDVDTIIEGDSRTRLQELDAQLDKLSNGGDI